MGGVTPCQVLLRGSVCPASTYVDVDVWGEDDGKPRGVLSKPTFTFYCLF
jgi:hypothetical protein